MYLNQTNFIVYLFWNRNFIFEYF